ncbi:hypothetical protein BG000_003538 [Podila horticola]|nr:hypothetical protein BG000_003538 [Podila horticola]
MLTTSQLKDYRDVLHSREQDVGIRLVPQDTIKSSEIMEFRFLDTPGLNSTDDRDTNHAVGIISEMAATVSFSLIIIVVSNGSQLSADQMFALEYYANIFRGLHSRILFLHTHVDYTELHHTNAAHHLKMMRKNKILGDIFRHPELQPQLNDSEVDIDYPSLTIDFETKKYPVKQCLTRNTIREILKMAAAPPAAFDTSMRNIERIRSIPHPTSFNCEERKWLEAELTESYKPSLKQKKYSILILGKTQSGKSTLVQFFKNYVDRHYQIDRSRIGTGNTSATDKPVQFVVRSKLPRYEVFNKESDTVLKLSHDLDKVNTQDDYEFLMKLRGAQYELREVPPDQDAPPSELVKLVFLDTPGFNDTKNFDAVHAENTVKAMVDIQSFNLVLFVINRHTNLSQDQQAILKFYSDIFKEFRSSFALLFTHIDYKNLYPDSRHHDDIKKLCRNYTRLLHGLDVDLGRPEGECTKAGEDKHITQFTHFMIDFDDRKKPVMQWLIRNTLRRILRLAVTNSPTLLDSSKDNIKRIRESHPSIQNDRTRKQFRLEQTNKIEPINEVEAGTPTGRESHSVSTERTHDVQSGEDININILLLGDIQSGKTSLVETMKAYASQQSVAEQSYDDQEKPPPGTDQDVRITSFLSELPTVEIRRLPGTNGQYNVLDLRQEARNSNDEDFDDLLNWTQNNIGAHFVSSTSQRKYHFNIYEAPSLNVSADNFEEKIYIIHKAIVESREQFHQVLFTLAPGPITTAIRDTIKICSDIFSDLNSLFSFVHTKIDYSRLHFSNKRFQEYIQERNDILRAYLPSKVQPFLIDCEVQSRWPVRQGKTQIVIREILSAATTQKAPAAKGSVLMKKTPKVVEIDTFLKWKVKDEFKESRAVTAETSTKQLSLLNALRQIDEDIDEMSKSRTRGAEHQEILCDDLEVIFVKQYAVQDENTEICSSTMDFDGRGRTIERLDLSSRNIDIELQIGGKGFDHWMIIFRRVSSTAFLDVKMYSRKLGNEGNRMGEPRDRTALRRHRVEVEKQLVEIEERMMDLWKVQEEYYLLRD